MRLQQLHGIDPIRHVACGMLHEYRRNPEAVVEAICRRFPSMTRVGVHELMAVVALKTG